jgi:hypothetical protein
MKPVSSAVVERARKFQSLTLQRVASVGQNEIAEQLQVSEATVSRFVSADLERACHVMSILGLKVVPMEMKCYPKDQIEAIFTLARASMNRVDDIEQLSFE